MFYDKQPKEKQENYKNMLKILGALSRLFSTADSPFLYYRAHENVFAKYFEIENNARSDDSADAYSADEQLGIGLKTWVGQDNQKVAEFGRLRPEYEHLSGMELIKTISNFRNIRIRTTKNMHGLKTMLYHIVKRIPGAMQIYEASFDEIDIDNITLDEKRGNANSIYFTDGRHTYHFSRSKNTLYMIFDDMELLDEFEVPIYEDPFDLLDEKIATLKIEGQNFLKMKTHSFIDSTKLQLCLRLYTITRGKKVVHEKSGLNQWNGTRNTFNKNRELIRSTPRHPNELYIPYPIKDRERIAFFPPRDTPFDLKLPNGHWISAKVCQDNGKAIMSNPNQELGKWLLRDVFELPEGTVVTYDLLKEFNIDSVIFTKLDDGKYSIDFCPLGTYEKFYGLEDIDLPSGENEELN